jgi:hypothetical protein
MRVRNVLLMLVLAAGAARARAGERHAPDEDLGGPVSRYADALRIVAVRGEVPAEAAPGASALHLTCVATPGDGKYVGIVQRMEIGAPLAEVEAILADVPHYKDLFPGLVDVREVPGSRDGNRYVTAWEQRVPVFFIPNTRYELTYLVSRVGEGRTVYRYRLARSGDLTNSDGIVVLEAAGPGRTRFTAYDFFNARWGVVPEGAVWRESLRGSFESDLAIKLKAEHPGWSYPEIAAEAERLRRSAGDELKQCLKRRIGAEAVLAR